MKRLKKKLKSQAGESLAETLIALLIAVAALVMLAGAISASANVIQRGQQKLDAYYSANETADGVVQMSGTGDAGTVKITESSNAIAEKSYDVQYYTNGEFNKTPVIAYKP